MQGHVGELLDSVFLLVLVSDPWLVDDAENGAANARNCREV